MAPRKKPARRKPNTGAVRCKKGRALPWEAAFPLGEGGYRYEYFATSQEAGAYLDQLTAERDRKEKPRNIDAGSRRVEEFLRTWLEMKSIYIKPTSLADYQYQCVLATEQIGAYRIDQIDREVANALIAYYYRRGYRNVAQLLMVLKQAFQYAEDENYIPKNPFARVKAPHIDRKKTIALSKEQRASLLDCAATEDNPDIPLQALWHLYSRLGLRRGEGIGLRWGDVDWEAKTITIHQNTVRVGSDMITHSPKTKRSGRTIPLPGDLLDLLHALRSWQVRRAADDSDWQLSGRVFVDMHGAPLSVWHVRGRWEKLSARAGLPRQITIHGLRHTALSILEKEKAPASIVQAFAGHSSATMTRHYTDHTTIEDMRRALEG